MAAVVVHALVLRSLGSRGNKLRARVVPFPYEWAHAGGAQFAGSSSERVARRSIPGTESSRVRPADGPIYGNGRKEIRTRRNASPLGPECSTTDHGRAPWNLACVAEKGIHYSSFEPLRFPLALPLGADRPCKRSRQVLPGCGQACCTMVSRQRHQHDADAVPGDIV